MHVCVCFGQCHLVQFYFELNLDMAGSEVLGKWLEQRTRLTRNNRFTNDSCSKGFSNDNLIQIHRPAQSSNYLYITLMYLFLVAILNI